MWRAARTSARGNIRSLSTEARRPSSILPLSVGVLTGAGGIIFLLSRYPDAPQKLNDNVKTLVGVDLGFSSPSQPTSVVPKLEEETKQESAEQAEDPEPATQEATATEEEDPTTEIEGEDVSTQTSSTKGHVLFDDDQIEHLKDLETSDLRDHLRSLISAFEGDDKIEALRLHSFWKQSEGEITRKHTFEREMQTRKLRAHTEQVVAVERARLSVDLTTECQTLEDQFNAEYRLRVDECRSRIENLYSSQLEREQWILGSNFSELHANQIRSVQEAVKSELKAQVEDAQMVSNQLSVLQDGFGRLHEAESGAKADHLAAAAALLDPLPDDQSIRVRRKFDDTFSAAVRSAMIPGGFPGALGRSLGWLLASINLSSWHETTTPELSRAYTLVGEGNLREAAEMLEKLQGPARNDVKDWIADSRRVAVTNDQQTLARARVLAQSSE